MQALTALKNTLHVVTAKPSSLDAKLAEYAFVPISQVLRNSRQVPVRALELCLECISVLLRTGWGGGLEPALAGQLLILFTFLAKPSSAENGIADTSEELQSLAFQCMTELFVETTRISRGREAMTATANIPSLGEAVLVMVDSLSAQSSAAVRLQAVKALGAIINAIADDDALASFLPRMVSSLTKLLTPTSSARPGFRIVEQSLNILSSLLSRLLSDEATRNLPNTAPSSEQGKQQTARSTSWLHATAAQIKLALASIFRLREHDKVEVRSALLQLCLCIVQRCRLSLSESVGMAIETIIGLIGHEGTQDKLEQDLKVMLAADQSLSGILRESLHGWIVSLPRLMRSKDDHSRRRIIQQVSATIRLFDQASLNFDDQLAQNLRDGVSSVIADSKGLEELADQNTSIVTNQALMLASTKSLQFQPLKLRFKGQDNTMSDFKVLVQELARSDSALQVALSLVGSIDAGTVEMRLASSWLAVNLIRDVTTTHPSIDDFMDLGLPNLREEILDNLYSHALATLGPRDPSTELPWHFYALALEVVALQAMRYRLEFRAELSEVLYPVLDHLGSSNAALRDHATTCLNIISEASGYADAGELVVANVDYIVNAIGLKLAVGDVSPQAPQVLLMMMRLCGPSLLPYLDDLVGSIFDALERYHGYPKLAELLFSVLKGMTEEGIKAPQLALTAGSAAKQGERTRDFTITDVVEMIRKLASSRTQADEDEQYLQESFPNEPWKKEPAEEHKDAEDDEQPAAPEPEEPKPPAPRTFSILLKISELTQHYLTTTSPSLRNSLLSLLRTTIPALAQHENSFLPLINTLWPVLVPRLQDPEAYIVSNALDIVALMCEHAGDFMRTRIEDAWDIIRKVHRRTKHQSDSRKQSNSIGPGSLKISAIETGMNSLSIDKKSLTDLYRPELYVDAPTRMIWNSLVSLLCTIARFVTVKDERFDEMLDILDPVLERQDVREALDACVPDAVWLRVYKKSKIVPREKEVRASVRIGQMPVGRAHWKFVRV